MEKFGLFDLIEKFNSPQSDKKDDSPKGNYRSQISSKEIVGTPPQLMMNAKTREFLSRHDDAVKMIRLSENERKKRARKPAEPTSAEPKKRRGRPPKKRDK